MKSDTIIIDNQGNGFEKAVEETGKVAAYRGLDEKDSLHLQLCAEEMLSLARSITGEMQASFWLESEGRQFDLHMSTKTVMDLEKRNLLLSASTTKENEAAKSFLGKLRDAFEEAMASEVDRSEALPDELLKDLANHDIELTEPEWDGYEQSVLRKLADTIKIGIRGGLVDMTVSKHFE